MINIPEKKNRIISFLKETGPCLPVRIGKIVGLEPFLASAVMSELLNERKVKQSEMKIGTSSLYLLEGQEHMLENFADALKSMEKTAYLRIKEKKVLVDENEEPAIRVALRSIRDFAIPFKYEEKIMWRYAFSSKEEIQEILSPKPKIEPKEEIKQPIKEEIIQKEQKKEVEKEREKKERKIILKKEVEKEVEEVTTILEEQPKPQFYNELITFLKNKSIELLEELEISQKEIIAKVVVNSTIGNLNFLLVA
jgi:hypothetical protein